MGEGGRRRVMPDASRLVIIERPRLTRLLDEADAKVLMLVAPAGFGKTTLAEQWSGTRRHVWYRGSSASGDIAALAASVAALASELVPRAGERMVQRMRAAGTPEQDVDILAELFASDLVAWPPDAWLVIDDYHFAMASAASERFVDRLVRLTPVRILLASRERPTWATPRRLLYDNIFEVGKKDLAMSSREASAALVRGKSDPSEALVALSEGWPAVIGMAALTGANTPTQGGLPTMLYDYFAEELYAAATPRLREALLDLVVAPSLAGGLPEFLFGAAAIPLIEEARRLGFISQQQTDLNLHPLLRTFLEHKLGDREPAETRRAVDRVASFFLKNQRWDDALILVNRYFDTDLYIELFATALPYLRQRDLSRTLSQWVQAGIDHQVDAPIIDLAEAEIAFTLGEYDVAERMACAATVALPTGDAMKSRAWYVAGSSAHLADRDDSALEYFAAAAATSTSPRASLDALAGRFLSAAILEHHHLDAYLDELTHAAVGAEERLRTIIAQLYFSTLHGSLKETESLGAVGMRLLKRTHDPRIRSSFLHSWSNILLLRGEYARALDAASHFRHEVEELELTFASPHALLDHVAAEWGLNQPARALQLLQRLSEAVSTRDVFVRVAAAMLRARIHLSMNLPQDALGALAADPSLSNPGITAEYLVLRALTLSRLGDTAASAATLAEAAPLTHKVEATLLSRFVDALNATPADTGVRAVLLEQAYAATAEAGAFDVFVLAYRAAPEILTALAPLAAKLDRLFAVFQRARDVRIASKAGLRFTSTTSKVSDAALSPRELQVGGLVARGLSNSEIAQTLFISEKTVKVHLRHIFEKLGVRTRTQAALRMTADSRLGDASDPERL